MLRWDYLSSIADEKRDYWANSHPTHHVIIDDFLDLNVARQLADFSAVKGKIESPAKRSHKYVRGKAGIPRMAQMTNLQQDFLNAVNSPEFLEYISSITGIDPIYPDPELNGGGLHSIRRGGYLDIHTDFNFHPTTKKNRRLNLLFYLNEDWKQEWNGNIELWDTNYERPFFSAPPLINRVFIFETSETSFHGHPVPLAAPRDVLRKSIAVYYYSDWPEGVTPRKATNYQYTRQQWARLISRIADLLRERGQSEDEIVRALEVDYMTNEIRKAYKALNSLSCDQLTGEPYWEYPDGTVSITGPEGVP
jgi:Rps23 Pro-64 3,4-dihydroxylase Tpa1-like proline 4-hydroxylase